MVLPITNPTKSYWIEAAESPLRDHRSTEELPEKVDLLIIGSGYTGATAAYWISKFTENGETPSMLMLDARDICGAATGRNGGQLRPHFYSRWPKWSKLYGTKVAHDLIKWEVAHLSAFPALCEEEGITKEVCLQSCNTFDGAMSQEAWDRLKGAYDQMRKDLGPDAECIRDCGVIEDPKAAEDFTQMKGCMAAITHPSGSIWPYKFVHALLRIVMDQGKLNVQAHTPVESVSDERDADGYLTVKTSRGTVKAKAVLHGTNRWASHLLPEFSNLIFPGRATIGAIKAPEGFIKNTGAQQWDSVVNNYHVQLPPPHNTIIIGGAKPLAAHDATQWVLNDDESVQFKGVPDFYPRWPKKDIVDWPFPEEKAELALPANEGGVWTGIYSSSIDGMPFVGPLPGKDGQFVSAGYAGHGMPRILLCTAHITPKILDSLGVKYTPHALVKDFPDLPAPFAATKERIDSLQSVDHKAVFEPELDDARASAKKPWCAPYAA